MKLAILVMSVLVLSGQFAAASCEVVKDGGAKSAFDGSAIAGLQVEKKSLVTLNKEFPALNAVEKAFKGEVMTCTTCTANYIACN